MGYRLNVRKMNEEEKDKIINVYYGTKLYGYTTEEELISYMYLVSIGKLEHDEFFAYSSNQFFALNKKEFTIFCYLYNIDMEKNVFLSEKNNWFINQKEIQNELMYDINEYDNTVYLISWC